MSETADQSAEVQEQLDFTAKLAQQKSKDDLQAARERWREQETVKTEAFQREQFGFVAGTPRRYVGFKFLAGGAVEVVTAEWTLVISSTMLAKEETLALIATLQGNTK